MRRAARASLLLAAGVVLRAQSPVTDLSLSNLTITSGTTTYQASNSITASTVTVSGSASVTMQAGNLVRLTPGFVATAGSASPTFRAVLGTPVCDAPPVNVSVSPASNTTPATSGRFSFTSSANSAACIDWMEMNVNYDNVSAGGCFLAYWPGSNTVALAGDDGYTWPMSGALGSATVLQNSQCSVNLATSTVDVSSTGVTLNLDLTFLAGLPGMQKVFLQTGDVNGLMASWQQMGTWQTTAVVSGLPSGVSIGPSSGTGLQRTFTYVGSSVNSYAYITAMVALIGTSSAYPAVNACYVYFDRSTKILFLLGDSGAWDGTTQQRSIGVTGTMSNSQCTVDAGASSASGSGNNVTLNLALSFNANWGGAKGNYLWVYDRAYQASGWYTGTPPATWTVGTPPGGNVATPSFSPTPGAYTQMQSVTISTATPGASIRYTTDGNIPTSTAGVLYTGPIAVAVPTTIRAIAYKTGMADSGVTSGTYTIGGAAGPALTITSTHVTNFRQGQSGATYVLTVANNGTAPTNGTAVSVLEAVPAGLFAASIGGNNWSCKQPAGPCTTAAVLAAGASYPPITMTVNVSANAPATVTNQATVSGGGSGSASASDATAIDALPRYASPLAFATSASVVAGVPTNLFVTYTSDNGPADIASGQVKIDNCYLAWDSAGNVYLYGSQNGYPDAAGTLGQAATLWAGNCSILLAGSSLSTPAANPKALVLKLNVTFPGRGTPSADSTDFFGPHEVYAWGSTTGGLDTGQVDLGALVVSQGQDFALTLTPGGLAKIAANASVDLTLTARGVNGFAGSIAVATQLIQGYPVNCFSVISAPAAIWPNTQATITVRNNNCPSGTAWVTVAGTASGMTRPALNSSLTLDATPSADFSVAVGAPTPGALTPQGSVVYAVTVASVYGQVGWVTLSLQGSVPAGVSSYFSSTQVYLNGSGNPETVNLTFYGSAQTPGGTYPLQVAGALGAAARFAGFSLTTQVTTFQVTSVTGGAIVHNTGQEVQAAHTVPAGNAPVYTTCSTADPNVTCRVVSSSSGTVTVGVTAGTTATHGTRVLSLNDGASWVNVGIADLAPSLSSVQPSSITAGQSSGLTLTGSGFPCDSLTEWTCDWPHVVLQGRTYGDVLTGFIDFGSWSSLSVVVRPDIGDTYDVTVDTCGMDWDPLAWEPISGDSRKCVSNAVLLAVAAVPPRLFCTSPVTRGQKATCSVSGVAANAVSSWLFTGGGATVTGPAGTTTWTGIMVVGGAVTASFTNGASLTATIVVNNRSGFAFSAVPPVQQQNGAVSCGGSPLSVPEDPPGGSGGDTIGRYCLDQQYSFQAATVSGGPNSGFNYVTNIMSDGNASSSYNWVISNSLNNRAGALWSAQCGNYSGTTGYISGENLRANSIRHESDTSAQSHWVNYRSAQNDTSNNLGIIAEAQTATGSRDDFMGRLQATLGERIQSIYTSTNVEPFGPNYNGNGVFQGYVNFYPYQPCN